MRTMRGKLFGIAIAVLGITAGLFGIGPVALAGSAPPAHASVDDFSYDGWRVEYRIGTDDEGRAIPTSIRTGVSCAASRSTTRARRRTPATSR
jgi:hypothetical protein